MKNIFLLIVIFFSATGFAQDYAKFNSMKQEIIASPKDTLLVLGLLKSISTPQNNIQQDSLVAYYNFLLGVSLKIPFHKVVGSICSSLGGYYNGLGNYTKALTYLFEGEKAFSADNNYSKLSSIYSTIGSTYMGLKNNAEQQKYFSKSYDIAVEHNLTREKAYGAIGMASYFGSVKSFMEAVKWNEIAVQSFKDQKNYVGYCIALSNGAGYYMQLHFPDRAEQCLEVAEKYLDSANSNYTSFVCYQAIAELLKSKKNYNESIQYYQKCLKLMIEDKAIHNISETYLLLSQTAYEAKLYKESTDYLVLHIQFKDSVFNENSSKQLLEVQEKYETDKKNVEISLLSKENDLARSELDRKKVFTYSAIAVTILLLILFVFVIKSNIQKNKTNNLLEKQNVIIEEKQKEIVDSINYAKRIQYTFLPNADMLKRLLPEHFVFFQPKDIVSGDFYWMEEKNDFIYLAVCDCTGHGVPGAFMSLLNSNFLNEAINEKSITNPAEVLNYVRKKLIVALDGGKDGMDTILIKLPSNFSQHASSGVQMEFASANNKLVLVQNGLLREFATDKMPVGKGEHMQPFSSQTIELNTGDTLYLYTDGYPDQFGGPKGKKFKYKPLNELLLNNSNAGMSIQAKVLASEFTKWKGGLEQVDDVCVIAIKF